MKRLVVGLSSILFMAVLRTGPVRPLRASAGEPAAPQEVQKPKYDYMSTFLSRSTQPLGLREDPVIKKLLGQGAVKWAIRAGSRHKLN